MLLLSKLSPLPSCFPNFHPQILLRQEVSSSCPNQCLCPPGRVLHLQLQGRLQGRLSRGARPTAHSHAATEPVARDFVQHTQKYPGCEQNKRPLVSPPPQKALVLISRSLSPEFPGLTAAGLQGPRHLLSPTSSVHTRSHSLLLAAVTRPPAPACSL